MSLLQMLKHCFNPRIMLGLAVVGVGLFFFAPKIAAVSWPVLFSLICPLSMLLMMWGMGRMGVQATQGSAHPNPSNNLAASMPCCEPQSSQVSQLTQLRSQREELDQQIRALEAAETESRALPRAKEA